MKIGVFATFMSPNATPSMIKDFGKRAEGLGLDSIWMGEHVALFDKNTFGYPGSKDGRIPVPPGGGMLDVTATRCGGDTLLVVDRADQATQRAFLILLWDHGAVVRRLVSTPGDQILLP